MARFDDLAAFAAVVRAASFTKAAAQLGVSQSALSQTVRTQETRLNLKLLNRTTRSVATTEAGERLFQTVGTRFDEIEAELAVLDGMRGKPAGTVRISATEHAATTLLWPRLKDWLPLFPDIKLEISSDNRFADIVAERFDIGVRLGADVAKDMIAVRIAPDMRMVVAASPSYLEGRERLRKPLDLHTHDCVGRRLPTHHGLMTWDFARRGKRTSVQVSGRLVFNSTGLILDAALAGQGIAWLPEDVVAEHITAGRLVSQLDDWAVSFPGYHLYYATRRA
ncbi:MAG: Transcriptional regulator [Rhizobacter sp.]|nr:Transcriptional regulator [Rhizobacter sp.]